MEHLICSSDSPHVSHPKTNPFDFPTLFQRLNDPKMMKNMNIYVESPPSSPSPKQANVKKDFDQSESEKSLSHDKMYGLRDDFIIFELEKIQTTVSHQKDELNLSGANLSTFPLSLKTLSFIKKIDLSNNFLRELPSGIDQLKSLEQLNLSNNLIQRLPSEIDQLKSLKYLNLFNNPISEIPDSLKNQQIQLILPLHLVGVVSDVVIHPKQDPKVTEINESIQCLKKSCGKERFDPLELRIVQPVPEIVFQPSPEENKNLIISNSRILLLRFLQEPNLFPPKKQRKIRTEFDTDILERMRQLHSIKLPEEEIKKLNKDQSDSALTAAALLACEFERQSKEFIFHPGKITSGKGALDDLKKQHDQRLSFLEK